MENSVIKQLNATNWDGQWEYESASGSFNANGQKILNNVSGNIEGYGSFDANRYDNDQWNYNPHFTDPSKAADLISIMINIISAIQAELGVD